MTLSNTEKTLLLETVRDAAQREIMPRFRALSDADISAKSAPDDLVTAADLAAEARITQQLRQAFPNALIFGEEAAAADPSLRDRLADTEIAIIIDPVDGTLNYVHGLALFGVILAVTHYGEPIYGLLYDPVMDDWIVASADATTCYGTPTNSRALRLSKAVPANKAGGYIPLGFLPARHRPHIAKLWSDLGKINTLRCSCHEFRMLAQGHVDFVLSVRLTPWDHAAGALVVQQAGGVAKMLDGSVYPPTQRDGYMLAARNASAWSDIQQALAFLLD